MSTDIRDLRIRIRSDETQRQLRRIGSSVDDLVGKFNTISRIATFGLVGAGLKEIVEGMLRITEAAERVGNQFANVFGANAETEFFLLREEVERLGLEFQSSAESFALFAASTRETALEGQQTRDIFLGVAEAVATMGIDAENAQGVFSALSQIAGKGVVSMEELRLQLGDRLPGAMQVAARAMNMTVAELTEMVSTGNLLSEEFLPKFARQLREEMGSGGERVETLRANLNRLSNAFIDMSNTVLALGIADMIRTWVGWLATAIKLLDEFIVDLFNLDPRSITEAQDRQLELQQDLVRISKERAQVLEEIERLEGRDLDLIDLNKLNLFRRQFAFLGEEFINQNEALKEVNATIEQYQDNLDRANDEINVNIEGLGRANKLSKGQKDALKAEERAWKEQAAAIKIAAENTESLIRTLYERDDISIAERLGVDEISGIELERNINELKRKLGETGDEIGIDFASKFWDVFKNQGEFTIQSLVGTFQSWGLEIAQSGIFDKLFEGVGDKLGQSLTGAISNALASFGVGATAGGLAGGGSLGILAGIGAGAGTGFAAGGGLLGALIGGGVGGLGALLGGLGGGSDDTYRFRLRGGLGSLQGFGGRDAGNFGPIVAAINDLEIALARALDPDQLARVVQELDGFNSQTIRMVEGTVDANAVLALAADRIDLLVEALGPRFEHLFNRLREQGVSTDEAVESLLAMKMGMEELGIGFKTLKDLIEENELIGESYAETIARLIEEQRALDDAAKEAAEAVEQVTEQIEEVAQASYDAGPLLRNLTSLFFDFVDFLYEIEDVMNSIAGNRPQWLVNFERFQDAVSAFQGAVAQGAPLEVQQEIFNRGFKSFQTAFQQAIQQVNVDLQEDVNSIRDKYRDLSDDIRDSFTDQRNNLQEQLAVTQAWAGTLDSITSIINDFQTGATNPFGISGQIASGQSNINALRAQFAGATGAGRAAIGQQLADALRSQFDLTSQINRQGSFGFLDEYNRTIAELTEIQNEATQEAIRQTEIEEEMNDLQRKQTDALDELNRKMEEEIAEAERFAERQLTEIRDYSQTVINEFDRVGRRLFEQQVRHRIAEAEQEAENLQIQRDQLIQLQFIVRGFESAGLINKGASARTAAKQQRYV